MQPTAPAAAVGTRKTSPIVWVLLAFGVIAVLGVCTVVAGGIFVVHKARQAGLDPALWERNPGLAATKMLAAANPDAEIVSMNEGAGVVVVRDRKTGKTIRMNFADLKSGHMSFESDGEKVSVAAVGDGNTGAVELKSKDGTARFAAGSSVKLPSWLPAYSGATNVGGFSGSGPDGDTGTYGFKTTDSPATVAQFYETSLQKAGFTIQQKMQAAETTVLTADNSANSVNVAVTSDNGQTSVTVSFAPKKKP